MAKQRRLGARENEMHAWRAGGKGRKPDEARRREPCYNKRQRSADSKARMLPNHAFDDDTRRRGADDSGYVRHGH